MTGFSALNEGDRLRMRFSGSDDDWCLGRVAKVSPNWTSALVEVVSGALRPFDGRYASDKVWLTVEAEEDGGGFREVFTGLPIEVDVLRTQ